jgi:HrpA-like RNA helicase
VQAWEDEKHSLQAIIGEDCVRFPSKNSVIVSQELPFEPPECDNNETSIDSATHGLKIELHAQILDGLGYPKAPPLLGVECSAMARPQLRSLTSWLCEQAAEHAHHGLPCISELAGMLPEMAAMVSRSLDSSVSGDDEGKEAQHKREHYHAQQPRGDEKWKEQESMNARKGNWASWRRGNRQQQYLRQRWSRQQDPSFIEQENVGLKQDLQRYLAAQSGKMAEMRNLRAGLPAYGHAAEVMQAVQNSRVVVLSGETGCGKSTQVPQQILDATIMANAGGRTKIVCTQPRRISAIGLADRVADERCESVGDTVGYRVRLDNKKSDRTRLLFCTTGILLRQLIEDPHLSDLSHIVVDEVHERSVEGDLLLLLLRKALGRRPDLRVILMSATADSELFLNYFKDVPPQEGFPNLTSRVHIPGLTHAVHDYFLEDLIELTGFSVGKGSKWARKKQSESRPDLGKSSKNASSKSLNAAVREEEEEEEEEDDDDQRLNEVAEGDGSNEVEHSQDEGNQTTAAATPGKVPQDGDEWEVAKGFKKEEDVQEQEPEFESWEDGFDEWDVEQVSGTAEQETNGNEKAVPDSWDADTNDGRASCVRTNEDNLVDLWDDDDGAIDEAINAAAVHAAQTNEEQHQEQEEHLGSQDNIEDVACGSVYRVLETDSGSEDNTTSATPADSDTKSTSAIDSQQYVQTDEKTQLLQQQALGMDAIARVSRGEYKEQTKRTLFNIDEEVLNYELIEAALAFICHTELETGERELIGSEGQSADECASHPGAILIFMPGMAEIMKTLRKLEQSPKLNEASVGRLWLLPLHGSLAAREQKMVFEKPPHGVRKVVLATNVAETALTVDDVRYVIDTGRLKEMTFDGHKGLAILEDAWVSKASATQRRGRAGRTAPGACLKLFSQNKHAQLEKQQTPEIQRTPLESLCLRVKAILGGNPHESLIEAISPPDKGAVDGAVSTLHALGALDQNEELTPLGQHLVRMPVDPKVGKMLIYAALLQCVDPVLTVASCIGGRGIFMAPQGKKDQADACKRAIGQSEGRSDHLAAVAAFNGWLRARERGKDAERAYCDNNFLSQTALEGVLTQRADFAATLAELGFLTPDYWRSVKRGIPPSCEAGTPDSNSRSKRIVKAALCAGFYPNVARIEHPRTKYVTTAGGAKEKKNEGHQVRFFTRDLGRVFIHPTSVNFGVGKFESPWMVYTERVKTSKVYLRESTMVPSYTLLLFGGAITVHHERGTLKVDDWAEFEASPRTAVLVRELRRAVDGLLLDKIEDPALDVQSSGAVNALLQLLATDGV